MPVPLNAVVFGVGDFCAGLVVPGIQYGFNLQSAAGPGGANEIDDGLVIDQGLALPVQADEGEQPVLDLIPLAGSRWIMTDSDRGSHLMG